jgi:hypothetical protein
LKFLFTTGTGMTDGVGSAVADTTVGDCMDWQPTNAITMEIESKISFFIFNILL